MRPDGYPSARARKNAREPKQRFRTGQVSVMTGSDFSQRRLPTMSLAAPEAGPSIWLTAGVHGDEAGAVAVVHDVFRTVRRLGLKRGVLRAFPLINPFGFETKSRLLPLTEEDLNRLYPGNPNGTLGQRITDIVWSTITAQRPALVMDLHNDWPRSIPYCLVDPPELTGAGLYAHNQILARYTGLTVVEEDANEIWSLTSTLSGSLGSERIPSLTLELGGGRSVDEANVNTGLQAVLSILAYFDMLTTGNGGDTVKGRRAANSQQDSRPAPYQYIQGPVFSRSGIIRFFVEPGQTLRAGTTIAKLYNAYGKLIETLKAQQECLVLGYVNSSLGLPGEQVVALGLPLDTA